MKDKHLTEDEFEKTFAPGAELIFVEQSPFSEITAPRGAVFFATHWNDPQVTVSIAPTTTLTTGTAYAVCIRDPEEHIKIYAYKLKHNLDGSGMIQEHDKELLGYHWVENIDKIPSFMKDQIPPKFLDKLSDALGGRN